MARSPKIFNSLTKVVEEDGTPSQPFRSLINELTNNTAWVGTGTPDGVLEAAQYSFYIDETTPATPVMYIKMLAEVGGDRSQGWSSL